MMERWPLAALEANVLGTTLVARAERSPVLPPEHVDRMGRLIPHAAFVEIPGAYHHLVLDAPDAFTVELPRRRAGKGGLLRAVHILAAGMFAVEGIVPFLIFAGRRARFLAFWILVGFQGLIMLTGNYCFFNLLTIALCFLLLDDAAWRRRHLPPLPLRERVGVRGEGEASRDLEHQTGFANARLAAQKQE
jgi:hypothetical protein